VVNVTRQDLVEPTPVREELLDLAPEREGDFFRVPRILGD
jgi:aspartyl-tRNA(Asn)/glutamyl-tRNA(Gln) amidotransferase subunit C